MAQNPAHKITIWHKKRHSTHTHTLALIRQKQHNPLMGFMVMRTGASPGQRVPTARAVGEGFEPLSKTSGNTAIALRGSAKCSALFDETFSADPILSELITLWPQLAASVREALLQQATQSLTRGP